MMIECLFLILVLYVTVNGAPCAYDCPCYSWNKTCVVNMYPRHAVLMVESSHSVEILFQELVFPSKTVICLDFTLDFEKYINQSIFAHFGVDDDGPKNSLVVAEYPNPQVLTCIQIMRWGEIVLPYGGVWAYPSCEE